VCDVVTINAPLHPETEHLFNDELIGKMKRARTSSTRARKICDRDAIARACESGQLAGYAGDVWFPQRLHRIIRARTMPHHGIPTIRHEPVGPGSATPRVREIADLAARVLTMYARASILPINSSFEEVLGPMQRSVDRHHVATRTSDSTSGVGDTELLLDVGRKAVLVV